MGILSKARVARISVVIISALASQVAYAQPSAGSAYVIVGGGSSQQDGISGTATTTYGATPGGSTHVWAVGAGGFVVPRASVELEIAGTGTMKSRQRVRTGAFQRATYDEGRRDLSFNINLRLHLLQRRRVQFNSVHGIGIVQRSGWSQPIAADEAPFSSSGRQRRLPTDVGFTMGFDLLFGGERFGVGPSFRFWQRLTDSHDGDQYLGGASDWTMSPRVVAIIDF